MVQIIRDAGVNRIHLTASGTGGGGNITVSAGANSLTSGTLNFSNANGVSFGLDGAGNLTASISAGGAQSAQTLGVYATGNTGGQSSSSTIDARSLSVSGVGIVTAGLSAGMLLVSATQSGQAAQGSNGSFPFQTLSFSNANGLSFGTSAGSAITASYTVPSTAGLISAVNVSAGSTSNNLSALTFSNSNGLAFGLNGSVITGSYTTPVQTNQTLAFSATGNTTQGSTTTIDARSLIFNGLGGASVGYSAGSIQISAPQTVAQTAQTLGLYAVSNTTGASSSSTIDARSFSIQGAGNVYVGLSNGTFIVSGSAGAGGGGVALSAGTNSTNTGTVVFSNSNGISFGMNTTGVVTASYTVPSTAGLLSAINVSAGTTSNNLSAVTFSNSNGLAFGLNGSVVTGSYTVPTVTNSSWTVSDSATSGTVGRLAFTNLNGVTLSLSTGAGGSHTIVGSHNALTSQSNQNITAANGGFAFQTLSFSNLNGMSFGTSAGSAITASYTVPSTAGLISAINVSAGTTSNNLSALTFSNSNGLAFGLNGSVVTGSYTVPTQSVQSEGWFAVGNTTGATSNTTLDARSISLQGAGNVSVGYTNGSVVISGGTAAASPVNFSAGTTSGNLGSVVFSNANGVSFGLNGSTITASAAAGGGTLSFFATGNTTQNSSTSLDARSLTFNGLGAQTVGYSNGSIQLSVPAVSLLTGVNNITVSSAGSTISVSGPNANSIYRNVTQLTTLGTATAASLWSVQPFNLQNPLNASYIMVGANASVATAANTSSAYLDVTISGVFYTQNVSTLSSIFSFSNSLTQIWRSNSTASVQGALGLTGTFAATTLQPGEYWVALYLSTANSATGGANTTALANTLSMVLGNNINATVNSLQPWGAGTNASNAFYPAGVISTNQTLASIPFSSITMTGSRGVLAPVYFELRNSTYQ